MRARTPLRSLARPLLAAVAACALALAAAAQVRDGLRPGDYAWSPALAPAGPVLVVVSLPAQRAWVYRNGVRIGTSTVSTGRPGHETPAGIYTILQKRREHYSNLYDDAPMPFMQRLTWDGIALHAGHLPGYPASHGCIRLPLAFAERLFATTDGDTTVVVSEVAAQAPLLVPGPFAGAAATSGTGEADAADAVAGWHPERAAEGPLTLLLGTRDGLLVALRGGVEIGRAAVTASGLPAGTFVYTLREGRLEGASALLRDRPARPWDVVVVDGDAAMRPDLRSAIAEGRLAIPPPFAGAVYDALVPGTTLVVTDQPLE